MAKQKGIIPLSGKIGNVVFTQEPGEEARVRRTVTPGTKRNEPALKQQYSRAAILDKLASEINTIIKTEAGPT